MQSKGCLQTTIKYMNVRTTTMDEIRQLIDKQSSIDGDVRQMMKFHKPTFKLFLYVNESIVF